MNENNKEINKNNKLKKLLIAFMSTGILLYCVCGHKQLDTAHARDIGGFSAFAGIKIDSKGLNLGASFSLANRDNPEGFFGVSTSVQRFFDDKEDTKVILGANYIHRISEKGVSTSFKPEALLEFRLGDKEEGQGRKWSFRGIYERTETDGCNEDYFSADGKVSWGEKLPLDVSAKVLVKETVSEGHRNVVTEYEVYAGASFGSGVAARVGTSYMQSEEDVREGIKTMFKGGLNQKYDKEGNSFGYTFNSGLESQHGDGSFYSGLFTHKGNFSSKDMSYKIDNTFSSSAANNGKELHLILEQSKTANGKEVSFATKLATPQGKGAVNLKLGEQRSKMTVSVNSPEVDNMDGFYNMSFDTVINGTYDAITLKREETFRSSLR